MCEMSPIDSFVFVIERDSPISFIRGYLSSNTSNRIHGLNIKKPKHYKTQINPKAKFIRSVKY